MTIEFNHPVYDEGAVWQEESWTAHSAQEVPWYLPIDVSTCIFVNGVHTYPGPDCPHDGLGRENPEDIAPGWTAQQRNQQ